MATRDTKENYNAYMREFYRNRARKKYGELNNKFRLLSDEVIKYNNQMLNQMLVDLGESINEAVPPKYRFEVPSDLLAFASETNKHNFNIKYK